MFRFPDLSVTRDGFDVENCPHDARWSTEHEEFSKPPFYRADAFVLEFKAGRIPRRQAPANSPRVFLFEIVHVPYEDMYPHCEVKVSVEGSAAPIGKLPETVKKELRQKLSDAVVTDGRIWKPGEP